MGILSAFRRKKEPRRAARPSIEDLFIENSGVIRRQYGRGRGKREMTIISNEQLRMGFMKGLKPRENVWMRMGEFFHHVGIIRLGGRTATITVSPLRNEEVLRVGETRKFSTISRRMYDLKVTLKSVSRGRARIFLQGIEEPVNFAE